MMESFGRQHAERLAEALTKCADDLRSDGRNPPRRFALADLIQYVVGVWQLLL